MQASLETSRHSFQLDMGEVHSQRNSRANASSYYDDSKRWAKNTGVVMLRNTVSVLLPTAAREGLRRTVFKTMAETHPELMTGLSLGIGLLPVALQLAGLGKEYFNGTQTRETVLSRIGLIALTGGCVSAAAAVPGRLLAVAPAILSANIYVALRDGVQYFVRLKDNNAPESSQRCGTYSSSSLAYAANQLLVGVGMDTWTSALTDDLKETGANVVARSLLNFAGETVDELFYQQSQHWFSSGGDNGSLDLTFDRPKPVSYEEVVNTALTSAAGRSALFSSAFNAAYAPPDDTWKHFSETGATWASNAIVAGVLGVGYSAFVGSHMRKVNAEDAAPAEGTEEQNPDSSVDLENGEYIEMATPRSSQGVVDDNAAPTGNDSNSIPDVYPAERRTSSASEAVSENQVISSEAQATSSEQQATPLEHQPPSSAHLATSSEPQATSSGQQATPLQHQPASPAHLATSSEQEATSSEQQATPLQHQPASPEHLATSSEPQATSSEQQAMPSEHQSASPAHLATSSEQQATSPAHQVTSPVHRAASSE
ncbi:hypothetical protein [Undibacterium sp. TS12]|uniref:hypothetical protein n=1 Tax=Undibacterium sp. TS12 TaxID=2908202 RepID=UPI001F4CA798|nr:hypothetical protein [Undibacterium sp. TS12]MCH8620406.1 hypothetical protein [Undibacterium sp. TS12]